MNKEILRLAIPNILSNLSIPLLSTVDTALMGRLSEEHIGAVGLASMIFNFVYWNFGFLRMGTTGITAQFFGKQDKARILVTLLRAGLLALILGLLILVLQIPLREGSIVLMQANDEVAPHISTYFNIRIWAAPATLMLYALMGWFFGMQNAIYPLILTVSVNVVNMILSYVLVFHYDMEIAGVAWGTVIAQYVGLVVGIALFFAKYRGYRVHFDLVLLKNIHAFRQFLLINRDIFVRTLFLTFVFGFFYSQSSSFGDQVLAVNVILLQYVNWLSYGIDGFAFATESLVGKYFGAGNVQSVRKAIQANFAWAFAVSLAITLTYAVLGDQLIYVFTDQEDIISAASPYLFWMVLFPVIGFACYIWDGIYIGLTASKAMRNSMALALLLFLIIYFPLKAAYANHGLWMSLLCFLAARGILQWIWYRKYGLELS